ncbi:MAG: hypothetical protein BEN18_01115 [Epulopiscium sp. Nuni2H_MBin001]|nr:MAG: hypothetical protein BEN18_01115 [Epulopiscium sp. Nuni2H_MBin001]
MTFLCYTLYNLAKIERVKQTLVLHNFKTRPLQLLPNCKEGFSAVVDSNHVIHVVAKTVKGQVLYIVIDNSNVTRTLLFEETEFVFDNFYLANLSNGLGNRLGNNLGNNLHFFYTASFNGKSALMHQVIGQTVETLILDFNPKSFSIISSNDDVYILLLEHNNPTELNCLSVRSSAYYPIIKSQLPIQQFEASIIEGQLHIAYINNMYGQNQLLYKFGDLNTIAQKEPIILATPAKFSNASILKYMDSIWINYIDNGLLYTMLSVDEGALFSKPIKNSIQGTFNHMTFSKSVDIELYTNALFVTTTNQTIRIPVIASMDIYGLHPDVAPNIELELFLAGFEVKYDDTISHLSEQLSQAQKHIGKLKQQTQYSPPNQYVQPQHQQLQPNQYVPQQQQPQNQYAPPPQTQQMPQLSKKQQELMQKPKTRPALILKDDEEKMDLKRAKEAFMNNVNTFDAPMKPPTKQGK